MGLMYYGSFSLFVVVFLLKLDLEEKHQTVSQNVWEQRPPNSEGLELHVLEAIVFLISYISLWRSYLRAVKKPSRSCGLGQLGVQHYRCALQMPSISLHQSLSS
jgi:hypothetical protein